MSVERSFEIDRAAVREELVRSAPRTVLFVLPEGVLHLHDELQEIAEELGIACFIGGDPHWGGCDVPVDALDTLGVDLIVSLGHTRFFRAHESQVVFLPLRCRIAVDDSTLPAILAPLAEAGHRRLSVGWSTEFERFAEPVLAYLRTRHEVLLPRAGALVRAGQVLGCDYHGVIARDSEVDAHLLVSDAFHSTGALYFVDTPVWWLNPYDLCLRDISALRAPLLRRRVETLRRAETATRFGVVIERRLGQRRVEVARRLAGHLRERGASATLLFMSDVTPERLRRFVPQIELFVNTACPRIESFDEYDVPVLNLREALALCGRLPRESVFAASFLELDAREQGSGHGTIG